MCEFPKASSLLGAGWNRFGLVPRRGESMSLLTAWRWLHYKLHLKHVKGREYGKCSVVEFIYVWVRDDFPNMKINIFSDSVFLNDNLQVA